jgi:hypothetical protein
VVVTTGAPGFKMDAKDSSRFWIIGFKKISSGGFGGRADGKFVDEDVTVLEIADLPNLEDAAKTSRDSLASGHCCSIKQVVKLKRD